MPIFAVLDTSYTVQNINDAIDAPVAILCLRNGQRLALSHADRSGYIENMPLGQFDYLVVCFPAVARTIYPKQFIVGDWAEITEVAAAQSNTDESLSLAIWPESESVELRPGYTWYHTDSRSSEIGR